MSAVGTSGSGAAAVFRGPAREPEGTQLPGSTVGVLCECGERTDEFMECWECGLALCPECVRVRIVDGYVVTYCPVCAPALSRGDE
jgi:hypothetical protein